MATKRWNYAATGATVLTAIAKDTITGGPSLDMSLVKRGSLSALVTVKAETDTIAIESFWEISNVGGAGPWYEVVTRDNFVPVVEASGTAAADAAVSVVLGAPGCVYSALYARASVRNRFIAGTVNDTYAIGYNFAQEDGAP
jgi:hypothetical protein